MRRADIHSTAARIARTFARDESGGTAIEYSLMLALIAMACIIAFNQVGDAQTGSWGNTANKAANAMNK